MLPYTSTMCDTLCAPGPSGMVFAKNSDRPPGEVQVAWPFGRRASAGCTLRTQYLSIGDTGAHAALLSCPTWLWGAEHGVNEYGVAIGNERVATTHDAQAAAPALMGMDLVRLGLERARSAVEAVDVMTGPSSSARPGWDRRRRPPGGLRLLLPGRRPAPGLRPGYGGVRLRRRPVPAGTAISNRLTLGTDWTRASPCARTRATTSPVGSTPPSTRRTPTSAWRPAAASCAPALAGGLTAAATAAHLRDHGPGPWGAPGAGGPVVPPPSGVGDDFSGVTVCMHVRDLCVTAASMIAELPPGAGRRRARCGRDVAAGSPCVSVYVPGFPRTATGPPPFVPVELSGEELWHAADAVRRRVEDHPDALDEVRAVLQPVEDELWAEADAVLGEPGRWAASGASWGSRALHALRRRSDRRTVTRQAR